MASSGGETWQPGPVAALLARGRYREAAASCLGALQAGVGEPQLYLMYGQALAGLGRVQEAAEALLRALHVNPAFTPARLSLASLLLHTGSLQQAADTYQQLLRHEPANVQALVGLGTTCLKLGDPAAAEASCRHALDVNPRNIAALVLAADIDEKQGRLEQAHARLQPMIAAGILRSDVVQAYTAVCRALGRPEEAIASLGGRGAGLRQAQPTDRAAVHFALGGLHDAAGEYDRAFAHYRAGNRINARGFDRTQPRRDVRFMMDLYTPDHVRSMPESSITSSLPIFVVGMHRSGTTLVEQILDCHPGIHGAGELPDMMRMLRSLGSSIADTGHYLECLPELDGETLGRLGGEYLARLTAIGGGARRAVDKMPGNFMYLGVIRQLFPGARVIHCVRNPMDTCLSGYFQNFGGAQTYMNDLGDLGYVYRCYHRMMEHWVRVLDLPVLDVVYEQLVTQPEREIRRLLEFCDVEWDSRCMDFHASARYVNTASYDQVRRPLYTRSIGRWKRYSRHLEPLRQALGDLAA